MESLEQKRKEVSDWLRNLQLHICSELEEEDSKGKFKEDRWERPGGGGGLTRVLTEGEVIEKGGVNFSAVKGVPPKSIVMQAGFDPKDVTEFFACGVSIVIHPKSAMVPIIHMNIRYFDLGHHTWWIGGGIDLTPHYVKPNDAIYFHRQLKKVCDQHHPDYYNKFKSWADDYFFIPHRNETRGIGGIFFDYLKEESGIGFESRYEFLKSVGLIFPVIYRELMKRNKTLSTTQAQQDWQLLRRGRYAEFNLVYDRGTKFGLESNGRTESILMSLPPRADWVYNFEPEKGSPEEQTISWLRKGIDWVNQAEV